MDGDLQPSLALKPRSPAGGYSYLAMAVGLVKDLVTTEPFS
jgi:hypothetical protein